MVNAFTWTRGNEIREFKTRAELYDHMVAVGDVILEGDDAPKFAAHVEKRAKQGNAHAQAAKARLEE
jgi:hypothetical protein